jgi:hypothetical protein
LVSHCNISHRTKMATLCNTMVHAEVMIELDIGKIRPDWIDWPAPRKAHAHHVVRARGVFD